MAHTDVKPYWELHLTLDVPTDPAKRFSAKAAVEEIGWKWSQIDGDPVLGPGVKCYATRHLNMKVSYAEVEAELLEADRQLTEDWLLKVTRAKVETVNFDRRYRD